MRSVCTSSESETSGGLEHSGTIESRNDANISLISWGFGVAVAHYENTSLLLH